MKFKKVLSFVLALIFVLFSFSSCTQNIDKNEENKDSGILKVHFFDVGQGDSEFIEFSNGKTMLIDAGEVEMGQRVVDKIKKLGYSSIDFVVATHPHSDHIGGLISVLNNFNVKNIYMPNAVSNTPVFDEFINIIDSLNINVIDAKAGVNVIKEDNLCAEFIAPNSSDYENLNDFSAVLKLDYYNNSFLFMGDAERLSEEEIMYNIANINADVLKVDHHGSSTSSSKKFINRVKPKFVVFEVGKNNDYNHPNKKVLDRFQKFGSKIFRTDTMGDILITSNGNKLSVFREDFSNLDYKWAINEKSKKVHKPNCESVFKIDSKDFKSSNKSIKELRENGYSFCEICNKSE